MLKLAVKGKVTKSPKAVNVCTNVHVNPFNSCEDVSMWTKCGQTHEPANPSSTAACILRGEALTGLTVSLSSFPE